MKVIKLIEELAKCDPNTTVRIYGDTDDERAPRIVGVDPYERVTILVTDKQWAPENQAEGEQEDQHG